MGNAKNLCGQKLANMQKVTHQVLMLSIVENWPRKLQLEVASKTSVQLEHRERVGTNDTELTGGRDDCKLRRWKTPNLSL